VLPFLTDFDEEEGDEGVNERDVRLDQVLIEVGDRLRYEYDFGDGWEHTIKLESIDGYDEGSSRARLVAGRRACPPEDCGGIGGYGQVLEALAAPDQADIDLLEWLGDYDPDGFSVADTDALLQLSLGSLGGSAAVEQELAALGRGYDEPLRVLVDRSRRSPKPLDALISAAELSDLAEPDDATKARMVRPWAYFLDLIGVGVKLTAAGWLPPALVTQIATDLNLTESWIAKANREDQTLPVLRIRESATALGLVRKLKGQLVPTAAGRRLAGDPGALWDHVARALPLGRKEHERHAGAIMLLAVAAGETPYRGIQLHGASLLWHAGWAVGNQPPPRAQRSSSPARPGTCWEWRDAARTCLPTRPSTRRPASSPARPCDAADSSDPQRS